MFIKVIRGNHENVYECSNYHIEPHGMESIREVDGEDFTINMEGGCNISIRIAKDVSEAIAIYAMNDQGHTFDTIFYKTKTVHKAN